MAVALRPHSTTLTPGSQGFSRGSLPTCPTHVNPCVDPREDVDVVKCSLYWTCAQCLGAQYAWNGHLALKSMTEIQQWQPHRLCGILRVPGTSWLIKTCWIWRWWNGCSSTIHLLAVTVSYMPAFRCNSWRPECVNCDSVDSVGLNIQ